MKSLQTILPKPVVKWSRRLLKYAAPVVAVLLLLYVVALPVVARRAAARALESLGFTNTTFQVRAVSLWHADLAAVGLGPRGEGTIDSIRIDYTLGSLWHGRVRTIHIAGAVISPELKVLSPESKPTARATQDSGLSTQDSALPFDQLNVRASVIVVPWEERRTWVRVQGTLLGDGTLNMTGWLHGGSIRVSGKVRGERVALNIEATDLNLAALATTLPQRLATQIPAVAGGTISIKGNYAEQGSSAVVEVKGARLAGKAGGRRVWAEELSGTVIAAVDGKGKIITLDGQVKAGQIEVDGELFKNIAIAAKNEGEQLLVSASGEGKDWRVSKLEAAVAGLFGTSKAYAADVSLAADMAVPKQVAGGIDVSRMGRVLMEGEGTVKVTRPSDSKAPAAWEASTKRVQMGLGAGDLAIGETVLRGLAGSLQLAANANNDGARLTVGSGSKLWVDAIEGSPPLVIQKTDGTAPVMAVGIEGRPAELTLTLKDLTGPWQLVVPGVRVTLAEMNVSSGPEGVTRARGVGGELKLIAKADANGGEVRLLEGSAVGMESLVSSVGEEKWEVQQWKVLLKDLTSGNRPALLFRNTTKGVATVLALEAVGDRPLAVSGKDLEANAEKLEMAGTVEMRPGSKASILAQVKLAGGSLDQKAEEIQLAGISATIPLAWNAQAQRRGEFAVGSIEVGGTKHAPVSGTLGIAGKRADFDVVWPVIKDLARVTAVGYVDVSREEPQGRIDAFLPAFAVTDPKALGQLSASEEAKALDITGTFAGSAAIQFRGSEVRPLVKMTFKDVNIENKEQEKAVAGLNGSVQIDNFAPLTTPGGQTIKVKQAKVGQLLFDEGVLIFRIEDVNRFHVEDTNWAWAGGRLYGSSFHLDLAKPRIDFAVTGDRLELAKVLDVFVEEQVSGEGTVYGRLPVSIVWPQVLERGELTTLWAEPELAFGEGFVYATPGGGKLRIARPEVMFAEALKRQDRRVRANTIAALKELDYSVLKMDFIQEQETLLARGYVAGEGQVGKERQPIDLTTNVRGFDLVLRNIMKVQRNWSFGE